MLSEIPALIIRRGIDRDVAAVRRIHQAAIRQVCALDYPADVIATWLAGNRDERYLNAIRKQSFWILEAESAVIGFGGLIVEQGVLESLFVDPDRRGLGLAGRLLQHLEGEALRGGVTQLRLDSSLSARGFYAKRGYRRCEGDASIRFDNGLVLEGIAMVKALDLQG